MAFTKQPTVSTYQTKTIPLMSEYSSRAVGFAKDPDFVNVFFEVTKNKTTKEDAYDIFMRPGTTAFSNTFQSNNVRLVYFWERENKFLVFVDNDIQIVSGTTGSIVTTVTNVFVGSTPTVGCTEFLYDSGVVKLVFTDGSVLKTIDNAWSVSASATGLPGAMYTDLVFLDGYIFALSGTTFDVYNSNLNDPLTWTAGDFISPEMVPDLATNIAKLNNYLVVFGASSIEYFWDAANATGSPLQRNDTPVKFNGFLSGLAQHGNKICFIGNNTEGEPSVFMLEDFKIKELGNESLRRQLAGEVQGTALIYSDWKGVIAAINGHVFYLVSTLTKTYAIDLATGLCTRWAYAGGTTFTVTFAGNAKGPAYYNPVIYISGLSKLSIFDNTLTTDVLVEYTVTLITHNEDFDSFNTKSVNRLTICGDRPTVTTNVSVSWSDDDYQTYSTAQTVNMNQDIPCLYDLGPFRRRAYKLTLTPTQPFRMRYLELNINMGIS